MVSNLAGEISSTCSVNSKRDALLCTCDGRVNKVMAASNPNQTLRNAMAAARRDVGCALLAACPKRKAERLKKGAKQNKFNLAAGGPVVRREPVPMFFRPLIGTRCVALVLLLFFFASHHLYIYSPRWSASTKIKYGARLAPC